jgi:hypothetical protein
MITSIVACGESAKEWYKTPCDLSIGVNDCVKFGHQVDNLVVVNAPLKFHPKVSNGHVNRFKTIIDSKPKRFFCHNSNWKPYFPKYELLPLRNFIGTYKKGKIYSSKTSPIVAITLAASLGATDIIIWGVDMLNHPRFSEQAAPKHQVEFKTEIGYYELLFEALKMNGMQCWIGNENTVLKKYLPLYEISKNSRLQS